MTALSTVQLDARILAHYSARVQADCAVILSEIQRDAAVVLFDGPPPYDLHLDLTESALLLSFAGPNVGAAVSGRILISSLRSLMHDYDLMIGAHGSALRHQAPHSRSEAIDMGRRAMHNEGAELVGKELAPILSADFGTLRLLFTLVFLLTQRR